uniref:Gamma-interferon-inducible lysosomal thiol reductase n=1 Tax=Cacopsylla melanoneura TaxID=428564 RepID=A0A8D8W0A1_9HEMI
MKTIFCLLLAVVSFHCLSATEEAEGQTDYGANKKIIKAKVALYMESLCPGCHEFIIQQLYPVFMKYPRYIQLDLLPYGNAKHRKNENGNWEFTCQHGEPECYGNLYLACATHLLQKERPKHLIRYYNCLADASSFSIKDDVKKCAPKAGINFGNLQRCVNSQGPEILAKFGDRTHALQGRKYVPTVVIDDKFDISQQDDIQSDLLGYLCTQFKGRKPDECDDSKIEQGPGDKSSAVLEMEKQRCYS